MGWLPSMQLQYMLFETAADTFRNLLKIQLEQKKKSCIINKSMISLLLRQSLNIFGTFVESSFVALTSIEMVHSSLYISMEIKICGRKYSNSLHRIKKTKFCWIYSV